MRAENPDDTVLRKQRGYGIILWESSCLTAEKGDYYHEAGINNRCTY